MIMGALPPNPCTPKNALRAKHLAALVRFVDNPLRGIVYTNIAKYTRPSVTYYIIKKYNHILGNKYKSLLNYDYMIS